MRSSRFALVEEKLRFEHPRRRDPGNSCAAVKRGWIPEKAVLTTPNSLLLLEAIFDH
jgi:hypothetical protein